MSKYFSKPEIFESLFFSNSSSKEIASIKKRHAEGLSSDAQYDADLLDQEIKFLNEKAKTYKKGSKEYEEAYALSEAKKLEATEKVHKLLEEAEKELANAKVSNLKEGIDKQKAIEDESGNRTPITGPESLPAV